MITNNNLSPLKTEICIIGAGPAGIITSLFLARQGIESLVVDKSSFPRSKPCADCITGNTIRILKEIAPQALEQLLEEDKMSPMFGINAYSSNNSRIKFDFQPLEPDTEEPSCYTVQRKDFDNLLANEAKSNPLIHFVENFSVKAVETGKTGVIVYEKEGQEVHANMLVNASGSNSKINDMLNGSHKTDSHTAIGIRGYFKNVEVTNRNFCELFLSRKLMPGGMYLSPLPNNRTNVNLVIRVDKRKKYQLDLKKTFHDFLESNPLLKEKFKDAEPLQKFEGSLLQLGTKKQKIYGERFIMAGDAAALIDILSANGIPQAFMSGKIAAQHITRCYQAGDYSEKALSPYQKEVRKATKNYLRMGRIASPFMKSEALLNLVDLLLNTFSAKLENNKTLESLVYHKKGKKSWIKPQHYKRLFFGMKN
jgi:geranylgeranyl reductase family protein